MYLLETINLKKSYREAKGKLEVLRGIDLQIEEGDIVAITGDSGSGKSTLLHLLGLLDSFDSGVIKYFGETIDIKGKQISEFRNRKIGFVFQFHYLLEDFTAEENIAMPALLAEKSFKRSIEKARDLLRYFDLFDRKDHYPNELSGGEQQRVAVARALVNEPDIVLADEPTGNLDERHSEELLNLITDLNKERRQTFVLVTHNKEIATSMPTHYHLEDGLLHKYKE